jgi:catechol 2,3-dioxygenase-like lactoylglutathione lyase family enzyme
MAIGSTHKSSVEDLGRKGSSVMRVWLHHVNLSSKQTEEMNNFYVNVVGLQSLEGRRSQRVGQSVYNGNSKFVTDSAIEFHLSETDHQLGFRVGHQVNPVDRGHIAFRTDDIAAFKKKLDEQKIPYSDYGVWGMAGWYQIFFYDPAGNVVEVHQEMPPKD